MKKDDITYFLEELCVFADEVYRLAVFVLGHRMEARSSVHRTFSLLADRLSDIRASGGESRHEAFLAMIEILKPKLVDNAKEDIDTIRFLPDLHKMNPKFRLCLLLLDVMEFSAEQAAAVLEMNGEEFRKSLAAARRIFMGDETASAEAEFFYAYVSEYDGGDLSAEHAAQMAGLLEQEAFAKLKEAFAEKKGKLQIETRAFHLSPVEMDKIHAIIQPKELSESAEAAEIERLGSRERFLKFFKLAILGAVVIGGGHQLYKTFAPKDKPIFDALASLNYETVKMEEENRINFPTDDREDVREFFSQSTAIDFEVPIPAKAGWTLEGASVLDYDSASLSVLQYRKGNTPYIASLFCLRGDFSILPAAPEKAVAEKKYRAYTTREMNLVAWEALPEVLCIGVSRRATEELVGLIFSR